MNLTIGLETCEQPEAEPATPLEAALSYLRHGWPVLPVDQDSKKPLVEWKPYQTQLPTEDEVKEWFQKWPKANIGIVTGGLSRLLVVDCDSEHALKRFGKLCPGADNTRQCQTGRGKHFYFRFEEGVRNNSGVLGTGIDVRGEGGFVIVPPSVHANGKPYVWINHH